MAAGFSIALWCSGAEKVEIFKSLHNLCRWNSHSIPSADSSTVYNLKLSPTPKKVTNILGLLKSNWMEPFPTDPTKSSISNLYLFLHTKSLTSQIYNFKVALCILQNTLIIPKWRINVWPRRQERFPTEPENWTWEGVSITSDRQHMLTKEQGTTPDLCLYLWERGVVQGQEAESHVDVYASGIFFYRIMA